MVNVKIRAKVKGAKCWRHVTDIGECEKQKWHPVSKWRTIFWDHHIAG